MNFLTTAAIQAGNADLAVDLTDNTLKKLKPTHIEDLVSIFRGYLGDLADNYALETTLKNARDKQDESEKCAKLVACLALFQDSEVGGNGGFAPTVANRSGFNYSIDQDKYNVFRYAFGLFWTVPPELDNQFMKAGSRRRTSTQGTTTYLAPPRKLIR